MANHSIVPDSETGFNIEVVTNGVHQVMLGFATEAEAQEWVAADIAREAGGAGPVELKPGQQPAAAKLTPACSR